MLILLIDTVLTWQGNKNNESDSSKPCMQEPLVHLEASAGVQQTALVTCLFSSSLPRLPSALRNPDGLILSTLNSKAQCLMIDLRCWPC